MLVLKFFYAQHSCVYHTDYKQAYDIFYFLFLFLSLKAYQYQLIILILLLSFLNMVTMLILVLIKNSWIKLIYFNTFAAKTFKYICRYLYDTDTCITLNVQNHGTRLDFLFQRLPILFLHAYNQHLQCLPCLDYCKNLLYQVTMFHQIFSSYPFIRIDKNLFLTSNNIC